MEINFPLDLLGYLLPYTSAIVSFMQMRCQFGGNQPQAQKLAPAPGRAQAVCNDCRSLGAPQ